MPQLTGLFCRKYFVNGLHHGGRQFTVRQNRELPEQLAGYSAAMFPHDTDNAVDIAVRPVEDILDRLPGGAKGAPETSP